MNSAESSVIPVMVRFIWESKGLLAPAEEFEFDFIDTAGEEIYVGFRKSELATLFIENLITPDAVKNFIIRGFDTAVNQGKA